MGKKQCVYPATNRWGWHMHSCREPCPNCNQGNHVIRGNNNIVYNQVALKKRDGTNGYHPVDTRCTLVGIETKWFDRAPQATIKIDGKTYMVKSTDLSIHTVKGEADRRANLKGRVRGVYNVMRAARHLQRAGRGQAQGGIPGPSSRRNSNAPNVINNVTGMQRSDSLSSKSSRQSSTSTNSSRSSINDQWEELQHQADARLWSHDPSRGFGTVSVGPRPMSPQDEKKECEQ